MGSRASIATPIKIRLVPMLKRKTRNRESPLCMGFSVRRGQSYLKIKEDTLLVYCLYFVGFLVRSLCGFDFEIHKCLGNIFNFIS